MSRESRKFDTRTMERFLRDGRISEEEYQKHLDALPDVSEKAVPVEVQLSPVASEEEQEAEEE